MRAAVVAVAFLLAGCESPTEVQGELLNAVPSDLHLELINRTDDPVYFIVAESEFAARTLYAICIEPVACPHVAPGASVSIPYAQIDGYRPGGLALVMHWRLVGLPMFAYEADEVRSLKVPLP